MSNLTVDQINKLTPPQLRKMVTDLGGEPMRINKANPVDMRKWIIAKQKVAKPATPAVRPAAAPAKPVAAAAPKPVAKAAPPRPVAPAAKPAAPKAAAPVAKQVPPKPQTPPAAAKEASEEKSWRETVELRLATLEAQLGVAATAASSAPVPVNNLASLDQYLQLNEETGEQDYTFDVADVDTFNEEQLLAAGSLLGKTFKAGTPVRVLRTEVKTALSKLAQQTAGEAEAEVEEETAEGEGAAEYEVGMIVQAMYAGELFDPCRVEKVFRKKDGSVAGYDIYFAADNTVSRLDPEDIVGLSEQTIDE